MRRKIAVGLGLLALSGCASDEAVDPQNLQIARVGIADEFVLAPGEFRIVEELNVIVIFHGVLNDSRCPPDVTCVWEGDAEVNIGVAPPISNGDERLVVLHTNSGRGPDATALGPEHSLRLVELQPASAPADQRRYRATFQIEGN